MASLSVGGGVVVFGLAHTFRTIFEWSQHQYREWERTHTLTTIPSTESWSGWRIRAPEKEELSMFDQKFSTRVSVGLGKTLVIDEDTGVELEIYQARELGKVRLNVKQDRENRQWQDWVVHPPGRVIFESPKRQKKFAAEIAVTDLRGGLFDVKIFSTSRGTR